MRIPALSGGLVAAALLLSACNGGDDTDTTTGQNPPVAVTPTPTPTPAPDPHGQPTPSAPPGATPTPTPVAASPGCYSATFPRRLTRAQFTNALIELSNSLVTDAGAAARIQQLVIDTAQFPLDASINPDSSRHQGYWRLDQTLNSRQVSAIHTTAGKLAADLAGSDARVSAMLGNCTGSADDCMRAFIRKAGRVLFRQPLSDAEVEVYRKAAGGAADRAAVTKVLATMIASPKAYFVVEKGAGTGTGNCTALTGPELATRLALHLWDSVPDASLIADADSGALLKPEVYNAQVARMLKDARADVAMRSFFRQWLRLDELVAMDGKVGDPKFDAFAGGFKPLATTRDAAINDVLDMVSYVASRNGSLQQVLTDRHSFARTADLAALYKTSVWDGTSAPPTFTEPQRVGLLTRIGLVANGSSDTTLPISRGIRVLSALTCQALPAPVMDQSNKAADLSGVLTTRERVQRITQMEGTSCVQCHQQLINPWGFVLEGFDALGRVRSSEVVRTDNGSVMGEKPIDSAVVASLSGMASRSMSSAAQAQQYVLESGHFERCFAKNYFRYAFGRTDVETDAAVIEAIRQQAASGANLRSLFAAVVMRDEFKSIRREQP